MQPEALRLGDALRQVVLAVFVHQETDRTALHAEDRPAERHVAVKRFEHESVTAEGDDDIRRLDRYSGVAGGEVLQGFLGFVGIGGEKGKLGWRRHPYSVTGLLRDRKLAGV